jgi:hypothetical protein
MKKRISPERFGFVFLLIFFSVNCSSNISLTTPEINRALPEDTPEICEKFAGKWFSNSFKDIEDEDKIICGDKPCNKNITSGGGFTLTCTDGKISGEAILMFVSTHTFSNTSVPTEKHEIVEEVKTSLRDIRIENEVLYLSYFYGVDKDCLEEISVSPKGKFLLGKYQTSGCRKPLGYADAEKGSILFVKRR